MWLRSLWTLGNQRDALIHTYPDAVGELLQLDPDTLVDPGGVVIETTDAGTFRRSIARAAQAADAALFEVSPLDDDLDSVFRYLVGR